LVILKASKVWIWFHSNMEKTRFMDTKILSLSATYYFCCMYHDMLSQIDK
jgi:hypothetical protein